MRRLGLVLGAWLLAAGQAAATVLMPADLPTLAREAGTIVRGRVVATEARWRPDHRGVETLVTLEVEASLKGALGDSVTFVVPGGRLGRFRNIVVGAPQFAEDQRVVVFLKHRGPSLPYVVGLNQGVFRLQRGASVWMVTPLLTDGVTTTTPLTRGDPARRPLPLDAFESRVRTLVGEP